MQAIKRIFWATHEPLKFSFEASKESFIVEEQTTTRFSGKGNHLIIHIQKQNLSTWDLVDLIAEKCNIPKPSIGYAGLKDKYATTTQYLSVPKRFKKDILSLKDARIKILQHFIHDESLRIGSLSGNRFTVSLSNIDNITAGKIEKNFSKALRDGVPNYFGYQRFGTSMESISQGKAIVEEDKHLDDKRLKKFFINAYSSHLFNAWLAKRITLKPDSKAGHPFKLLEGDVFLNTKTLKTFQPKKLSVAMTSFKEHTAVPTGLIPGRNIERSVDQAGEFEAEFDDISFYNQGFRRAAIIFATDTNFNYDFKSKEVTLKFTLPKSSYATVFLESIANKELN